MVKTRLLVLSLIIVLLIAAGCSNTNSNNNDSAGQQLKEKDWSEITELADGSKVRIFMWGGDEGINRYMDEWVAPKLKETHNIELERVPMDTNEILQKLSTEKRANKVDGTIDIIWINGENFKNAKEFELLYGPFSENLPNYQDYVDTESLDVQYDFGTEVEGLEAPWGKVQFVFQYDEEKIQTPPANFDELKEWIKENPGKFTYPEVNDFTGNAFLRHVLYDAVGGPEKLLENGYDEEILTEHEEDLWSYLREIQPSLWRNGETYPATLTDLDRLYSQGEVWMTMGYNEARAESLIKDGVFPESTKSFVLESGSIGNTHFLAIPFNSPNKAGAMVAIDYLMSPDAQLAKYESTYWGENMALDPTKLPEDAQKKLADMDRGASVLPPEKLSESLLPEVDAEYVNWLKEHWVNEVVQKQ
ncbi:ABC transporter substrate-binding protein [Sutcliffiella horikoshii]|uniref:ABC transporter substrate-binding protein n=1 Tax=Sutcliffiella horikoshii TaxID=79883 RepID=UPI001CFDBB74|nr:ABC transporter substrate-binding protein [Sutcliffiella horikoshii]